MNKYSIESIICKSGVTKYAFLEQRDIVYDNSFREICEKNSCGQYGRCWVCPPDAGSINELQDKAKRYKNAVIFQVVSSLEDSYDVEGMAEGKKRFLEASVNITKELKKLGEECFQMGVGGCGICDKCAKIDNQDCRFPDLAVPALETCGIFVSETAKNAGLKYINGENTVTYFGMVLY